MIASEAPTTYDPARAPTDASADSVPTARSRRPVAPPAVATVPVESAVPAAIPATPNRLIAIPYRPEPVPEVDADVPAGMLTQTPIPARKLAIPARRPVPVPPAARSWAGVTAGLAALTPEQPPEPTLPAAPVVLPAPGQPLRYAELAAVFAARGSTEQ